MVFTKYELFGPSRHFKLLDNFPILFHFSTGLFPQCFLFGETDFLPNKVTYPPNPEVESSVSEIVENPAERTITLNLNVGTVNKMKQEPLLQVHPLIRLCHLEIHQLRTIMPMNLLP